jgi:hypothetical protein
MWFIRPNFEKLRRKLRKGYFKGIYWILTGLWVGILYEFCVVLLRDFFYYIYIGRCFDIPCEPCIFWTFVETPTNINALMVVSEEPRNRSVQWPISVGTLFCSKGLGSGAGGRSAPQKHLYTFPVTLNAWSHPLWPLFRRECRGATRRSARVSLTAMW